jgi:phosphoribosylformimino-5-aminoimidazole carboxamide ribotide isomerase
VILIPVIDIASGRVVHARGGNRAAYPPLESTLCDSSLPGQVVASLLQLHPFTHLYIADLDAITGRGAQTALVQELYARFPGLHLWVDAGLHTAADCRRWLRDCPATAVLGSETLADAAVLAALPDTGRVVLSLDFRGERLLGPADLLQQTAHWPQHVIGMSLDHVGNTGGPDLRRIRQLRPDAGDRQLYAAGGVRDAADLQRLQDAGADGALLASALHNGRIGAAQLDALR